MIVRRRDDCPDPLIMGVLNVTPDSFSDGGRYLDAAAAIEHGRHLAADGADVIDVGGESSRPGAEPVPAAEQIRRVVPVIEALAGSGPRLSIDTRDPAVARAAVAAGADLVNDISASLAPIAAELDVGWIAMHMSGDPSSMQDAPRYDDVVTEVIDSLTRSANAAVAAGVREVWIDPGIGFGKTVGHNLALLARLDQLVSTGFPVVVGTSRKSTMGVLTAVSDGRVGLASAPSGQAPPDDRFEASLATAVWAMCSGARMVRVHDVRAHRHAASVVAGSISA